MGRGSNGNAGSGRPANSTGYKSKYEGMGINTNGWTQVELDSIKNKAGKSLDNAIDYVIEGKEKLRKMADSLGINASSAANVLAATDEQIQSTLENHRKALKGVKENLQSYTGKSSNNTLVNDSYKGIVSLLNKQITTTENRIKFLEAVKKYRQKLN